MSSIRLTDPSTYPSRRSEAWKYTDLHRALRDAPAVSPAIEIEPGGPFAQLGGQELAFANGKPLGADAFVASGEQVLRLRFVSDAHGTGHTASVRIAVKPGARLTLVESHEGRGEAYVANNLIELDVPPGAQVERVVLVDEPADAISITLARVTTGPGSQYRQTTISSGARLQRQETQLSHGGLGASVAIDGVYALSASRHVDLTTIVRHLTRDGMTSQLTKGVVTETARGVFQGKIIVDRGADGTDARMGHHALILGERAEVNAKPELEIFADDVQCAHGNTVGNLDEAALFYMQQRGLPEPLARAVLTEAFLIEVVDRIQHDEAREVVRTWLTARL